MHFSQGIRSVLIFVGVVYFSAVTALPAFGAIQRLSWRWPAERTLSKRSLAEVRSVETYRKLIDSPSFDSYIYDPIKIVFEMVLDSGSDLPARAVLIAPRKENSSIKPGQKVGLGFVDDQIVVCIKPAPDNLSATDLSSWLETMECAR